MMKKAIAAILAAVSLGASGAAFDYVKTVTAADGSQVRVRCVGNDSYVSYQSLDGKALMPDVGGELQYVAATKAGKRVLTGVSAARPAPTNAVVGLGDKLQPGAACQRLGQMDAEIRKTWDKRKAMTRAKASGRFMSPPSSKSVGTQIGFTVLADFPYSRDKSTTVSKKYNSSVTKEYVTDALNSLTWTRTTSGKTETSMRKYYQDQSQGAFDYSNVVTD